MKADPALLQLENYPYRAELQTEFGDVDVLGHLNNVALARYYESVRARFFIDALGVNPFTPSATVRPVIAEARYQYLKEGFFPKPAQAGLGVARLGRTSMGLRQGLFQQNACIGLAEFAMVLVGNEGPVPIPDDLRMRLRALGMAGVEL